MDFGIPCWIVFNIKFWSFLTHAFGLLNPIACHCQSSKIDHCNRQLYGSPAEIHSKGRCNELRILWRELWLGQDQEQVRLPCCRDYIGFQLTTVFATKFDPHLQDSPAAAANIPTTTTLQIHSLTFFEIRRTDATDHSKNQHQNRNKSFQCGSTNHLEQSSSQCQGRCHTRNISATFEDTLFLVGIQHLVTWLRPHDLALAHLRRAINLCTYLLTWLVWLWKVQIYISVIVFYINFVTSVQQWTASC